MANTETQKPLVITHRLSVQDNIAKLNAIRALI